MGYIKCFDPGDDAMRMSELKRREVINVCDCKRLGFVGDLDVDPCTGRILAISNESSRASPLRSSPGEYQRNGVGNIASIRPASRPYRILTFSSALSSSLSRLSRAPGAFA